MTYVLWQAAVGDRRDAKVRGAGELGVPDTLPILASVSDQQDLRGHASYIQLDVPGVGPVLAWVGVPGAGSRVGHFVHPQSGRSWPWGELRLAVKHAVDFAAT